MIIGWVWEARQNPLPSRQKGADLRQKNNRKSNETWTTAIQGEGNIIDSLLQREN